MSARSRLLYNLRDKGWVRVEIETSAGGRDRKIYHLTPRGRAALGALLEDWELFSRGMRLALSGSP